MPKAKRLRSTKPAKKRIALKATGRKRLSPTRVQRKRNAARLDKAVGYHVPKLSEVVGKKGASRHTVKKRATQYEVTKSRREYRDVLVKGHMGKNDWGHSEWILDHTELRLVEIPEERKRVGEKLIVKKQTRRSSGKGGEFTTNRAKAKSRKKKSARATGKRGGIPPREAKTPPKQK